MTKVALSLKEIQTSDIGILSTLLYGLSYETYQKVIKTYQHKELSRSWIF